MNRTKVIGIALGIIVLLAIFVALILRHKSQNKDLPDILESGRLSVLLDSSQMGFSNSGDSVFGFQYELVKAFADSLGLELLIAEETDLQECLKEIQTGDYDLIANLIPITNEWKNEALFSIPLFSSRQVLVQRYLDDSLKSKKINSQFDLASDSIYIRYHSPYKLRLKNLSNEIADSIKIYEIKNMSQEEMVRLVALGKIKYTICEERLAKKLKMQYPNLDISIAIGFEQQHAWIVHPKSPLLHEKLNAFLKDFIGSSAYWEIYRKYY